MSQKTALRIGAVLFGIIGFLHILRLVNKWDALIGGWNVPLWLSVVAVVVSIGLSYWYWKMSKQANQ